MIQFTKIPSRVKNKMFDELTASDRRNIMATKPKIMSCVFLTDCLLEKSYNNVPEIKSYIRCENVCKPPPPRKYYILGDNEMVRFNNTLSNSTDKFSDTKNSCNEMVENSNITVGIESNTNNTTVKEIELKDIDRLDEITMREMIFDKTFSNINSGMQYINESKTWSFVSSVRFRNTSKTMNLYECNLASNKGILCPVKKCLIAESIKPALLYRKSVRHNHDSTDHIFESEPCNVILDVDDINYMPSFATIEIWLLSISQVPNDDNTVYCVNYQLDCDLKILRFFLSTRQLLKTAFHSRSIHITSWCKMEWNQLDVILVGTTDLNNKFHHFGVAVCSGKTASDYEFIFSSLKKGVSDCYPDQIFTVETLLSDCNPSIQNAFRYVYGYAAKTVTCFLDFTAKLRESFDSKHANRVINDVLKLQMLSSTDVFNVAAALFLQKWKNVEKFKSNWLDENCNWYEGYSYFTPSKNTVLLAECEKFQKTYLSESQNTFDLFLDQIFQSIKNWSMSYLTGYSYAIKPAIPNEIFEDACRWIRQTKNIVKDSTDKEIIYYSNVNNYSGKDTLQNYRGLEFSTLNEFFIVRSKFTTVRRNQQNVLMCDCEVFFKYFVCRHTIGIGFLLNLHEIPLSIIPNRTEIPYYLKLD